MLNNLNTINTTGGSVNTNTQSRIPTNNAALNQGFTIRNQIQQPASLITTTRAWTKFKIDPNLAFQMFQSNASGSNSQDTGAIPLRDKKLRKSSQLAIPDIAKASAYQHSVNLNQSQQLREKLRKMNKSINQNGIKNVDEMLQAYNINSTSPHQ